LQGRPRRVLPRLLRQHPRQRRAIIARALALAASAPPRCSRVMVMGTARRARARARAWDNTAAPVSKAVEGSTRNAAAGARAGGRETPPRCYFQRCALKHGHANRMLTGPAFPSTAQDMRTVLLQEHEACHVSAFLHVAAMKRTKPALVFSLPQSSRTL
jgi:hypothetical protein